MNPECRVVILDQSRESSVEGTSTPATSAGNQPKLDARTIAELKRFGCDDPYDPRFIYRAVFGTGMRGHPQVWPDIHMDVLREVNPDVVGWIHMDGCPINYPL